MFSLIFYIKILDKFFKLRYIKNCLIVWTLFFFALLAQIAKNFEKRLESFETCANIFQGDKKFKN